LPIEPRCPEALVLTSPRVKNHGCRCCAGTYFEENEYFRGTTDVYKNSYFLYARCKRCGSINNLSMDNPDYAHYITADGIGILRVNRFKQLLSELLINKMAHILDYGCGKGALFLALKNQGYINIEAYDPFVKKFSKTLEGNKQYSVVYLVHVIEHIHDFQAFFSELNRVTNIGSTIITIHPSSTRIPKLNPICPFQRWTIHAPFHTCIPSDKAVAQLFLQNSYRLKRKITYDIQRSGIKDNNNVIALLFSRLGGTKEKLIKASSKKKALTALRSPLLFLYYMLIHTHDYFGSSLVFEKMR